MAASRRGTIVVLILVILLLVLHQDVWFWTDSRLVFGVMPVGLFYHACLSIAASLTWYIASRIAWPADDVESPPREEAT